MLEQLLKLPGFIYQIGGSYYYLGKWICKECTELNETDCVMMYDTCRTSGDDSETAFYFNKIRAYSDFALEIPYNPALIRQSMAHLLDGLSENASTGLAAQIKRVEEDLTKYC